jgi:hypothetical protein
VCSQRRATRERAAGTTGRRAERYMIKVEEVRETKDSAGREACRELCQLVAASSDAVSGSVSTPRVAKRGGKSSSVAHTRGSRTIYRLSSLPPLASPKSRLSTRIRSLAPARRVTSSTFGSRRALEYSLRSIVDCTFQYLLSSCSPHQKDSTISNGLQLQLDHSQRQRIQYRSTSPSARTSSFRPLPRQGEPLLCYSSSSPSHTAQRAHTRLSLAFSPLL